MTNPQLLKQLATDQNFTEEAYLRANPDVANAIRNGVFQTGRKHFELFGRKEKRWVLLPIDPERKNEKLKNIEGILREDMPMRRMDSYYDFLTDDLRAQFNIVDTDAVSSNEYDPHVMALIEKHQNGLLLDCGAGNRNKYFQNVVNFEIVAYQSTDVRGVGEMLPFKDNSFDGVLSMAVLEHVKDPWLCAKEIVRVLKPGGDLLCAVPFLQPRHGYPHHYFNMTDQGLRELFNTGIEIVSHKVPPTLLPIWSLSWILNSWANGLDEKTREAFKQMKVSDLLGQPQEYLNRDFVTNLPEEVNFELASGTLIQGKKIQGRAQG